uniref:Putative opsin n=1 Tax=Oryza sativa subsp. indica TaxID=39946 RepID=Q6W7J3_ORYSI|nr:putative opsin [Oryza sativa Indica Group]
MMIEAVDAMKTNSVLPIPLPTSLVSSLTATISATATASVTPLPTVIPGPEIDQQLVGDDGKKTLWVIFVAMVIASAGFAALSWRVPIQRRLYHVITTLILIFASISYFAMATGHGVSVHKTVIRHQKTTFPTLHHGRTPVFWARYVDRALTTLILLHDLSLLAGLNGAHIIMAVVADVIMILTGLFAAFGSEGTPQKWGWYAISCISFLVVIWHLAVNGRAQANARSQKVGSFFLAIAGYTLVLWTAYPIVWGIADGSRKLSVDAEIIAYAVPDVLAKPIFGLWLLITHANIPETNIDLGGFWSYGFGGEGAVRLEDDGA